ncbi:MAG: hypothetical protein AAF585_02625 [Verrucomicrobiota bacterium]
MRDSIISPTQEAKIDKPQQVRAGVIDFFTRLAATIGLPKSVGQIYGFLFASEQPIPFESVVSDLQISKGSASEGLKYLRRLGAVHVRTLPDDRRTFFEPETRMRRLATGLISETVVPNLEQGEKRLEILEQQLEEAESDSSDNLAQRIASLRGWHGKLTRILPSIALAAGSPPVGDDPNSADF